jgi:flagellar motor switch/type III secretory pathway protein FliN
MATGSPVTRYPWDALENIPRTACRTQARALSGLQRAVNASRLEETARELVGPDITFVVRDIGPTSKRNAPLGARAAFELADGSAHIEVEVDAECATRALSRLLKRTVTLELPGAPLDAALGGAFSALVLEIVRRVPSGVPVRIANGDLDFSAGIQLAATVLLDERSYAALVRISTSMKALESPPLASLGDLTISVPLVCASSAVRRESLLELEPGAAWLPGADWSISAAGIGTAVLAAPAEESGVKVELVQGGALVVRGETVALSWESTMAERSDDAVVEDTVLQAPIVVRVEVGAVTMTAREWASLRPGDVIETGQRVGELVVLRVAGAEVARGELVNVDGELGVRIRRLSQSASDPSDAS